MIIWVIDGDQKAFDAVYEAAKKLGYTEVRVTKMLHVEFVEPKPIILIEWWQKTPPFKAVMKVPAPLQLYDASGKAIKKTANPVTWEIDVLEVNESLRLLRVLTNAWARADELKGV